MSDQAKEEPGIERFAADMRFIAEALRIEIDRKESNLPATPYYFRRLVLAQLRVISLSLDLLQTYPELASYDPSVMPRSIGEAHVRLLFNAGETFDGAVSEIDLYLPRPVFPGLKEQIEAAFGGWKIYPSRVQERWESETRAAIAEELRKSANIADWIEERDAARRISEAIIDSAAAV
jgi:hypothetical protein